jgi:hypothetical protein
VLGSLGVPCRLRGGWLVKGLRSGRLRRAGWFNRGLPRLEVGMPPVRSGRVVYGRRCEEHGGTHRRRPPHKATNYSAAAIDGPANCSSRLLSPPASMASGRSGHGRSASRSGVGPWKGRTVWGGPWPSSSPVPRRQRRGRGRRAGEAFGAGQATLHGRRAKERPARRRLHRRRRLAKRARLRSLGGRGGPGGRPADAH